MNFIHSTRERMDCPSGFGYIFLKFSLSGKGTGQSQYVGVQTGIRRKCPNRKNRGTTQVVPRKRQGEERPAGSVYPLGSNGPHMVCPGGSRGVLGHHSHQGVGGVRGLQRGTFLWGEGQVHRPECAGYMGGLGHAHHRGPGHRPVRTGRCCPRPRSSVRWPPGRRLRNTCS